MPTVGQQALVRDGVPAIISQKPGSIVIARPAGRQFQTGTRPVYVIAIFNPTKTPIQFSASGISVEQTLDDGKSKELKVFSYDELVSEEKTRQAFHAFAVGLSAAGNSMQAANAGRYNAYGTAYTPQGNVSYTVHGYDPVAASIAQSNATAVNNQMIQTAIQQGQNNLDALERSILKDDTILSGEWYGGKVVFEAPTGENSKRYKMTVLVGSETHEFEIDQAHVAR